MAKRKKKSEMIGFSYPRVYTLVLYNNGSGDAGSTFGALTQLVEKEIASIDKGEADDANLKELLIIREQLIVEFDKGRYGPRGCES